MCPLVVARAISQRRNHMAAKKSKSKKVTKKLGKSKALSSVKTLKGAPGGLYTVDCLRLF
jgi:hypothetical protein